MEKNALKLLDSRAYRKLTKPGKAGYNRWIRRLTQAKFEKLLEGAEEANGNGNRAH